MTKLDNLQIELPPEVMYLLRQGGKVVLWDKETQATITIKYEQI